MELIVTHKNTDFDALASVFAAKILYPEALPVLPKSLNPNVKAFLSIHKDHFYFHTPNEIDFEEVTRIVVVDTNSWGRLEVTEAVAERPDLDIHLWDHHGDRGDIRAHWSRLKKVGSTTTLLVRQLEEEERPFSPVEATLFLAGIYEDTGNLSFPGTMGEDARTAGYLLERDADLGMINNFLRPVYGPTQKDILFEMLKNAERLKHNGFHLSLNKININGHSPGLSLVVDMYRDIVNVDAAFGIFSDSKTGRCIVIGRSKGDTLDIGAIMKAMGGGGHPNAGSAMLKAMHPDAAEEWIKELIEKNHQANTLVGDLMSFPAFTVSPETSMKEVALLLREKGCSGFPVVSGEKVVGVISRRDFKKVKKDSQLSSPVKAFMSTRTIQVGPEESLSQAVRLIVKYDVGRLPVVKNDQIIGIVTRSDAMRYYYDLLPD